MRRVFMIASALLVLALADYVYAVLYSYYKPPLMAYGRYWLQTPDWCALAFDLGNEGRDPVVLLDAESGNQALEFVTTLRGEMASSRPYLRPADEIVTQPVAGAVVRPRPDWAHPSYALRTKVLIGDRVPETLNLRYRYLGWPHVLHKEAPFQGETCVPHPAP